MSDADTRGVEATPDPESTTSRRPSFTSGPPVWLVAAVGTGLTAACFYPGYLNGDSNWQYRQGIELEYNDMHPVIMSWIWTQLDRVIEGSGGLFLLTTGLFWTALSLFSRAFTKRASVFLAFTFGIGLSPPMFSMLSQIHKDVGMVTALLLGYVLLLRSDATHSLRPLVLALLAFWYAVAVRHNGAAAVVPFTIWMSFLLVRDHLPAVVRRWRWKPYLTLPLANIALGTALVLAMIGSSTLATHVILGEKGVRTPYQQFLAVYDLVGISVAVGRDLFPDGLYYDTPFELDELEKLYHPHTAYFTFWAREPGSRRLLLRRDPRQAEELMASWISAIRGEPWAYARHRAILFLAHLGMVENTPFRKLEFLGATHPVGRRYSYKGPNVFGTPQNLWLTKMYTAAGGATYDSSGEHFWSQETGLIFRPWPYLLLSVLCVLGAWRARSPQLFQIALLGLSSLLYILPHLVVGVSSELRYMWWPILVSLLQALLLVAGFRRDLDRAADA